MEDKVTNKEDLELTLDGCLRKDWRLSNEDMLLMYVSRIFAPIPKAWFKAQAG